MWTQVADMCPEWSNEERMNVLFAPLRNKDLNPESWNAKVRFWINLIEKWSAAESVAVFDVSALKKAFCRNGKSPYCLPEVLDQGVTGGHFFTPENYLHGLRTRHQTWGSWVLGLGTSAVKAVGTRVLGSNLNTLVVPSVVERLEGEVLQGLINCDRFIPSSRVSYLTEEQVSETLNKTVLHAPSAQLIRQVLIEEKKIQEVVLDRRKFYKISLNGEPVDMTEVDKGLIHLKLNLDHLDKEIPGLEQRIQEERSNAKKSLKAGSRANAKVYLKRQKRVEQRLEKLLSQQLNLEHIYEELLSAETNKKIIQAYDSGLAAMQSMVDPSLLERTEGTMSDLAEILDLHQQISDSMAAGPQDDLGLEDLEKELEELGRESIEEIATDEKIRDGETKVKDGETKVKDGETKVKDGEMKAKDDETKGKDVLDAASKAGDFNFVLERLESLDMEGLDPLIPCKKHKSASLAS